MNPANFTRLWRELRDAFRNLRGVQLDNNVLRWENQRLNQQVSELEEKLDQYRDQLKKQEDVLSAADARYLASSQLFNDRTARMSHELSQTRRDLVERTDALARRDGHLMLEEWRCIGQEETILSQASTISGNEKLIEKLRQRLEEDARTIAAQGVMINQRTQSAEDKQQIIDALKVLIKVQTISAVRYHALDEGLRKVFKLNEQLFISMSDPINMDLPEGDVHMLPCNCGSMYSASTVLRLSSNDPARAPVLTPAQRWIYKAPVRPPGSHQCPAKCPVCKVAFTTDHFTRRVPSFSSACDIIRETENVIKKAMCSGS
jgi:hypothetical protein